MKQLFITSFIVFFSFGLSSLELIFLEEYYFEDEGLTSIVTNTDSGFFISLGRSLYYFDEDRNMTDLSPIIPNRMIILSASSLNDSLLFVVGSPGWLSIMKLLDMNDGSVEYLDDIIESDEEYLKIREVFWSGEDTIFVERGIPNKGTIELEKYSFTEGYIDTIVSDKYLMVLDNRVGSDDFIYSIDNEKDGHDYYLEDQYGKFPIKNPHLVVDACFTSTRSFFAATVTGLEMYSLHDDVYISEKAPTEETRVYSVDYDFDKSWLYVLGQKNDRLCMTIYQVQN